LTFGLSVMQTDPALVSEVHRLGTIQVVVAILIGLIALGALGVGIGVLIAVRKLTAAVIRNMNQVTPKLSPLLAAAQRIAGDAEEVADSAKTRVADLLETVDEVNVRLKTGVAAVETRIKRFGTVVDVVQSETENIMLDAASTARGVHSAAQLLRAGRRRDRVLPDEEFADDELADEELADEELADEELDDEGFTDQEEVDGR